MDSIVTLYALVAEHRVFLWNTLDKDKNAACSRAREILKKENLEKGSLFRGPTGKDEMEFVMIVY